jgi:transcriptional regulator with XRE-family HTH domain
MVKTMACQLKIENFAELLTQWLERDGRKQSWLADQLGLTDAAVSKMVNGKSQPSLDTLKKIQDVTGIRFLTENRGTA